jgi:hypothetical protein
LITNDLYIDRAVKKYTSSVPLTHLLGMSNSRTSKNWLFRVISTKNGGVESAIWLHPTGLTIDHQRGGSSNSQVDSSGDSWILGDPKIINFFCSL